MKRSRRRFGLLNTPITKHDKDYSRRNYEGIKTSKSAVTFRSWRSLRPLNEAFRWSQTLLRQSMTVERSLFWALHICNIYIYLIIYMVASPQESTPLRIYPLYLTIQRGLNSKCAGGAKFSEGIGSWGLTIMLFCKCVISVATLL